MMTSLTRDLFTALESNLEDDQDRAYSRQAGISKNTEDASPLAQHQQTNGRQFSNNNNDHQVIHPRKREVFHYQTSWLVSTLAWSNEPGDSFQLALGSYIEEYLNKVTLVVLARDKFDEELSELVTFSHPYPPTKILWAPRSPESNVNLPNLLATTADYLRLWRVVGSNQEDSGLLDDDSDSPTYNNHQVKLESLLNPSAAHSFCAPLTSLDWNRFDPRIIITSSVDTTCAIWDIETNQLTDKITPTLRSQVLAHNHEVYDVSFLHDTRDVFVSAGGDGSIRLFDLRRLDTSTILYEVDSLSSSRSKALVRVSCNKQDSNYISTFTLGSKEIFLLDLRNPGVPAAILNCHTSNVNSMSWAPNSAHHICSASDDNQALIWQLSKLPYPIDEPLLAYKANGHINAIDWSASHPEWIAIGYGSSLELLRV